MLDTIIEARRKDLGDGLVVGRVLPVAKRRMVGPFVFLDHMGPADFQPGAGIDVRPHPHIGLATVTFLFDGEIFHRDNLGYRQAIRPGELNWMSAGSGIVHSERTDLSLRSKGGFIHGLQAWVALPEALEEAAPSFTHVDDRDLPVTDDGRVFLRMVAGSAYALTSPAPTLSPLFYAHADLTDGARVALPPDYSERGAYIVSGHIRFDGEIYEAGRMLVFKPGGEPAIEAVGGPARVMLLGGEPLGPRFMWWNFVSSHQERIDEAKADWASGRMALPVEETEFIPLPE
ncbi:MAG: pirin family protein [Ancalomicrobiaceae bacterium]|nr:pirin family protein [Ancalomicrobiaceae bacterium]